MVGTKNYYDNIAANQSKLMTAITSCANQAAEVMTPDKELAEKGAALANEFLARPLELADEMSKRENLEKFQNDFWSAYTEQVGKSVQLSAELYQKSFNLAQEMWGKYSVPQQQERMRKLGESMQHIAKTYTETFEANAKIAQEYMTV